ncbi:MAG: nitrate- and nitrite sensing domain-containing protein [Burkholderiaceae bacterium]|nr:nitrate- and nitrite sensing domain-containing protein [Ottowia sp.]
MKSALNFLMASKRCEIAGLHQLALTSELVNATGRLVHALQRERGLTNLYLASRGERGGAERLAQVAASEALQAEVLARFEPLDTEAEQSGYRTRLFGRIAYALQGLAALPLLRERVQTQAWSAARATAAYARLIHALLSVVFEAADSAWDPDISRHLVALFNFMQGKEFAGQERATGAALFATGCADADGQQRLLRLIESQEQCLQVFADFASPPLQLAWQQAQKPDTLATLERLRRVLCTTTPGGALESHLSQAWFDVCTAHMDAMKSVEDAMAAELLSLCKRRRQTAEEDLRALEDLQTRVPEAGALVADTAFFDDAPASPGLPLMDLPHQAASFGAQMDRSILEIVRDQALRLQAMGDELDTVRSSLNERKLVERAKGLLMAHRQLSEDEAHKALRQMAMNQNRRLIEVADAVLAMAEVLPNPSPR